MSELSIFTGGVLVGGFVVGWALTEYRSKPPKVEIVIDESALKRIDAKLVEAYLAQRGLIWMPKGVEYMAKKEKP